MIIYFFPYKLTFKESFSSARCFSVRLRPSGINLFLTFLAKTETIFERIFILWFSFSSGVSCWKIWPFVLMVKRVSTFVTSKSTNWGEFLIKVCKNCVTPSAIVEKSVPNTIAVSSLISSREMTDVSKVTNLFSIIWIY